jgi:transketolase
VWAFITDGEFQEGQLWEAVQAMAHFRLDNLGVYVDVNGQQCDGAVTSVMTTEPLGARLRAFGARVEEVDGHDVEALARPAELAPDGRPLFVLARTDPCRGVALLAKRRPKLHYLRFTSDEERREYQALLDEMTSAAEAGS